ncbi:hypothetical protein BHM03_00010737, partial [Ensete ventricosum]
VVVCSVVAAFATGVASRTGNRLLVQRYPYSRWVPVDTTPTYKWFAHGHLAYRHRLTGKRLLCSLVRMSLLHR